MARLLGNEGHILRPVSLPPLSFSFWLFGWAWIWNEAMLNRWSLVPRICFELRIWTRYIFRNHFYQPGHKHHMVSLFKGFHTFWGLFKHQLNTKFKPTKLVTAQERVHFDFEIIISNGFNNPCKYNTIFPSRDKNWVSGLKTDTFTHLARQKVTQGVERKKGKKMEISKFELNREPIFRINCRLG